MIRFILATLSAAFFASLVFSEVAHAELKWVPKGAADNPIVAGREGGYDMYACRVSYLKDGQSYLLLGKTRPGWSHCNVGAFGREILFDNFEKLVGTQFQWIASKNVGYPANSVVGGHAGDGRRHLVCTAVYNDAVHPGYIADSNCLFGYGGEERSEDRYFVLVTENPLVPHEPNAQTPHDFNFPWEWVGLGIVVAFCAATGGTCVMPL